MHLEQLLEDLRATADHGIVALAPSETELRTYLWWGDRTLCLGLACRLDHSINMELEDSEVVERVIVTSESNSELVEASVGQYL